MSVPGNYGGMDQGDQEKLRLCFISNPNLIHTRRWVSWFHQHGHQVYLLADVPLKEPWAEVPVVDLSKLFYVRFVRFVYWSLWIKRFLKRWRPDVLHAHRINSAGWMAAASGFHPYVVTPWGLDIFTQPEGTLVAGLLARFVLTNADLVTTLSNTMSEQAERLGAKTDHICTVQFGVELDIFKPEPDNGTELVELRKSLAIPDHAKVVLSPRAITPLYNIDIILKSIPIILQHVPEATFVFLDYNTDLEYKKQLVLVIHDLSIEAAVRWLPPTRSRTEMAKLYRLSDVVVSVPSTDGTPVSVLEAMASGKPVISTDLPPLREFITNRENGLLVPVRQTSQVADSIIELLQQPAQAAEFGRKAHQVVVEKANSEVEMQRMEAIYYQLVKSRGR